MKCAVDILWGREKGGRQLEGNPTNRHQREGADLFAGWPLTVHSCHLLLPLLMLAGVTKILGSAELFLSCSGKCVCVVGGGITRKITNKTEAEPQSNAFQVPFLLESQAHPGKEETRK